ncbi:MAG: hypothetical protein F6K53_31890 [Moorea sp. SIO4A1]|uniref:hypothetical protein n=1 Tax=Moorena sp. SIO4A1 TaxID=2607835 RepID=UPI00144DD209|nr:hypothetical protein [Moorena sp. SIO4A1]NEQ61789.1 hypothetical protein [Moorena sp. SIO4A1]
MTKDWMFEPDWSYSPTEALYTPRGFTKEDLGFSRLLFRTGTSLTIGMVSGPYAPLTVACTNTLMDFVEDICNKNPDMYPSKYATRLFVYTGANLTANAFGESLGNFIFEKTPYLDRLPPKIAKELQTNSILRGLASDSKFLEKQLDDLSNKIIQDRIIEEFIGSQIIKKSLSNAKTQSAAEKILHDEIFRNIAVFKA